MCLYAYTRVSTDEQNTGNQFAEMESAGYTILAQNQYADIGISGSIAAADRPQWMALVSRLVSGDSVIVSKIDRLGRNAIDILQTVDNLSAIGVRVVVLQFGGLDFCSSTGRMMLTMLSAVAEFERSLIVERTKSGIERARKEGKQIGAKAKDRSQVLALLAEGVTMVDIQRQTGISRPTIQKWRDEAKNEV